MTQDTKNEYYEKSIAALEKHAETSNREVGHIQVDLGTVITNVEWLTRIVWWIVAGVGGTMFFTIIQLVITLWLKR